MNAIILADIMNIFLIHQTNIPSHKLQKETNLFIVFANRSNPTGPYTRGALVTLT